MLSWGHTTISRDVDCPFIKPRWFIFFSVHVQQLKIEKSLPFLLPCMPGLFIVWCMHHQFLILVDPLLHWKFCFYQVLRLCMFVLCYVLLQKSPGIVLKVLFKYRWVLKLILVPQSRYPKWWEQLMISMTEEGLLSCPWTSNIKEVVSLLCHKVVMGPNCMLELYNWIICLNSFTLYWNR